MKTSLVLALLFWVYSVPAQVQHEPTAKELQQSIEKIADLIRSQYVFPEKGAHIATRLKTAFDEGTFKRVKTWNDFDSLCTEWLAKHSMDNHLFVKFDPKVVAGLLAHQEKNHNASMHPFYFDEAAIEKNFGFTEVKILPGNVGLIKVDEINLSAHSLPVLQGAMNFVANTNALIIDLRENGGGGSDIGCVFESYFLPAYTELLEIHDRTRGKEMMTTVPWMLKPTYTKPLFILIGKNTASAAEALAFSLQHKKRAILVGQQTAGAAHMNTFFAVNQVLFISISTGAPTIPGTTTNWEQRGITPDLTVEEGHELEYVLNMLKK